MALLPEKFRGAQEGTRRLFPPQHAAPLVELERQVAIGLHPARIHRADDCLRSRADRQAFLQRLRAALRDPCHLGRKAFDMFRFLHQERFRDEHGEIGILMPRRLETRVHLLLDEFPDPVSIGLDDHAALDIGIVDHVGVFDDIRIPTGEILRLRSDMFDKFFLFCHTILLQCVQCFQEIKKVFPLRRAKDRGTTLLCRKTDPASLTCLNAAAAARFFPPLALRVGYTAEGLHLTPLSVRCKKALIQRNGYEVIVTIP